MDGGYIHDKVLLGTLEAAFQRKGFHTDRQVFVRLGCERAFIDLVAVSDSLRIAVEAELSARRIERDERKAYCRNAHELWVVFPNRAVLEAARRARKRRENKRETMVIFFLTLGQALQRVSTFSPVSLYERETEE